MTDQFEAWNGPTGMHWVSHADRYDAMLERLTPHLLAAAGIKDDDHVLDVGCGNGHTTRTAARAAASGSVTGVDISALMLEEARRRADGLRNVRFERGDVQVHPLPAGGFDVVISRFGVMFFSDPAAAFANLAQAVRPGGRLAYLCWQDPAHNEWIATLGASVAAHMEIPERDLTAPGGFSLARPERSRELLEGAGFTDVTVEPVTESLWLGRDPDDVVAFASGITLVRELLADTDPRTRDAVLAEMRKAMAGHQGEDGVRLNSAAWLVTARA